jgi:hypothetical protein
MVMDPKTIEAIYRMSHEQKLSLREISRQLHTCRNTIKKYLNHPVPKPAIRQPRPSKLDDREHNLPQNIHGYPPSEFSPDQLCRGTLPIGITSFCPANTEDAGHSSAKRTMDVNHRLRILVPLNPRPMAVRP